ncbi:MAG TPA: RCC1 domain-containing protein, partial [Polyangiaceae bacterium]
ALDHGVVVKQVATGASFTCALTSLGTVLCFGDNSVGQLGRPSQTAPRDPLPTAVPSLANVTEIAAGGSTACALQKSGVIPI